MPSEIEELVRELSRDTEIVALLKSRISDECMITRPGPAVLRINGRVNVRRDGTSGPVRLEVDRPKSSRQDKKLSAQTEISGFREFPKRGNVPEEVSSTAVPRSRMYYDLRPLTRRFLFSSFIFFSALTSVAWRLHYCVVLLAYLIKTGFRICPINDDLLPIGP